MSKSKKSKSSKVSNALVYQKVTDKVLAMLERGVVGWRQPWAAKSYDDSNLHRNMVSKKIYRGVINQLLCQMSAIDGGFTSPLWLSKKQIIEKGGSWSGPGTLITFWKPLPIETDEVDPKTGKRIVKTIPLLKYYYVWNIEQCTGIEIPEPDEESESFSPIEVAQSIIDDMPERPALRHGGNRAFYSPLSDSVTLPTPESFMSPEHYYSTGFHELVHSTGHEKRLGRVTEWTTFGSDPYATEELVAEFGAAMLCGTVGIEVTHEASASYIAHWSERFREDPTLLIKAASQAQKAADNIQGIAPYQEAEKAEELAHA